MKILVIIVTYNAMQWAERCFDSLRKSSHRPDIFVVDNGSTDGTQSFIQAHYPEVMFLQSEKNLGFGKANNIGLQYALDNNYDYVYLLNQDAWVMPDTFEKLIAISRKYPEYGILSPFQMNADLYHIDHNFIVNVLKWESNADIINDIYNQEIMDVYPVQGVMAAHWLMPSKTSRTVGGFSPSFPHYGEDDNYIDRVHFLNMKVGVVPSLRVVHDRGWRVDSVDKKIHIIYTSSIRALSNPLLDSKKAMVQVTYMSIIGALTYKSLRPLRNAIKIFLHSGTILKNRRKSMNNYESSLFL